MIKLWSFAKYAGCGNDFLLFDNRKGTFPLIKPGLIPSLCHRKNGIGADGILLLENSQHADYRMRIFNSDGSEAEMCGNGLRCFIKWLPTLGIKRSSFIIELMNSVLQGTIINENEVSIEMVPPFDMKWKRALSYNGMDFTVHSLNTGVPHAVIFMEEIEEAPLNELGSFIRHHPFWQPNGTNVNIAQFTDDQTIKVRTFERGVEGETLACGTGATAAALTAAHLFQRRAPLNIVTKSKEKLIVHFDYYNGEFSKISLTGPASCHFFGEVNLDEIDSFSRFSIASNSGNSVKST